MNILYNITNLFQVLDYYSRVNETQTIVTFLIPTIFSIIVTLIFFFVQKSKYKLVRKDYYAHNYLNEETLSQQRIRDSHSGTHVNKSKKMNSNKK